MSLAKSCFWLSAGALAYTHLGYPLLLRGLVAWRGERSGGTAEPSRLEPPRASLIVAAHDEEAVIERRVRDARALDYPRERLEVIVASDGSADRTVALAEQAGADLVLDLPRGGKVAALNAAVERADGEILAFSDANATWERDALRRLVERFRDPRVGYVCGQVGFETPDGDNQEGLYWRYEMRVRELESALAGVTAGNGAINAVRREAFIPLPPERGQDITFPFVISKRGWRAVYEPAARAHERLAASIGDEFGRKRRMMAGAWGTMLTAGMLSPRGYEPLYAVEIYSHRLLRYASPLLHLALLGANLVLLGESAIYALALAFQVALLIAAALAARAPVRAAQIARYYVAVTAASAAGLWDFLRGGVPLVWEKAEGTR